jgi:predicted GNAT family acetyltransferase
MSIDPAKIRLQGGPRQGRYVYAFPDGSEAEMDFVESRPGVVTITHTGTPRQHRGQGVAATIVARAVADFRAAGQKVIPACWFARDQFAGHPDWADLLYRS